MEASRTLLWRSWLQIRQIRRVVWPQRQIQCTKQYTTQQRLNCKEIPRFRFSRKFVTFGLIPVVSAFGFGKKSAASPEAMEKSENADEVLTKQADVLFVDNKITELYELLMQQKDTQNADILWRLARAANEMGKINPDKDVKKAHTYEAYEYIEKAMQLTDQHWAVHKWYAILLDYVGEYEGTKQRITNAYKVKEHLLKAVELNPTDATTVHSLGYWCFMVADLPWVQKKVASVIFATPPSSSYEEALTNFLEAEKVDPGFYSMNYLMIGKTYLKLKNKEQAKEFLIKARDYPIKSEDDKKANKESTELLSGLGVK